MKKKTLTVIAMCLVICIGFGVLNVQAMLEFSSEDHSPKVELSDFAGVQNVLEEYFTARNDVLLNTNKSNCTGLLQLETISSEKVVDKERQRLDAKDNLANYHRVYVISSENSFQITAATEADECAYLSVYEWTWVTYDDGKNGAIDLMGYATEHEMCLEKNADNKWQIISDDYTEEDILGVPHYSTKGMTRTESSLAQDGTPLRTMRGLNSNITYNVNAVVEYADSWVNHEYPSDSSPNMGYYNLTTYGYYSSDCANYVSQCIRAGGAVWDYGDGKDNGNWDGTQWWFDINPISNYENYTVCPPSWRFVPKFIQYWENQGYGCVDAFDSNIYPGNPVLTDDEHVGICVGYNSAGIPIINAHTKDVYHVPYTMIGSEPRKTIQITSANMLVNTPANATTLFPTTSNQSTPLQYLGVNSNNYYAFTVSSPGYYTLESSYYSGSAFNTRAYLYKESILSEGVTLYMYEVARDDDSGTGLNFKIREYLNAGTYYLRVRAYSPTITGYYYLYYKKG